MDQEFSDLIPVFVEEARDRLDRLATRVPDLGQDDDEAVAVVKRELHTLKGSTRMLQLGTMAELCHAAEDALVEGHPRLVALLTRTVDRLVAMLGEVSEGRVPEAAGELVVELRQGAGDADAEEGGAAAEAGEVEKGGGGDEAEEPEGAAPADAGEPAEGGEEVSRAPRDEVRIDVDLPSGATGAADDEAGEPGDDPEPAEERQETAVGGGPAPTSLTASDIRVDAGALDEVADRATQLRLMALGATRVGDRMYELAHLAEDGLREPEPKQVLAVLSAMLRRLAVELEGDQRLTLRAAEAQLERVLTLQLQPLRGALLSMARYARQIAASLGREVEVEIAGQDTRLDRRIARDLEDSLIHLVRNAVDHGLEPPEVREKAGKPRAGLLRLSATTTGSRVRLEIRDDGPGVSPEQVIRDAVDHGLVDPSTASGMGRDEAYRLLFTPGFSTRRRVSEISGRGVGLDVVASAVARVGGEVFLRSEPGEGTVVAVEVPMARRGEQVLVLKVGELRLALPSSVVRGAHEIGADDVLERGGKSVARVDGRLVPFIPLSEVYGETTPAEPLLLEGAVSGQRLAVLVDDVEAEEEVLVRPLPQVLAKDRMLEGIALLASGLPVAVLSPAALARRDLLRARPRPAPVEAPRRVRVLLVDDSLVTREMERRLLEDAGFTVVAAGDSDEALSHLGEESFDCIVTDIEMPGMDGFELTEHLRSMDHFAQLPIVVVSTRDRPEDRLRGLRAGADAYLTKQSLDAGELVDLVQRLAGR